MADLLLVLGFQVWPMRLYPKYRRIEMVESWDKLCTEHPTMEDISHFE